MKKCNFGKTVLILTPHMPPLRFEQHEIEKSKEIDSQRRSSMN